MFFFFIVKIYLDPKFPKQREFFFFALQTNLVRYIPFSCPVKQFAVIQSVKLRRESVSGLFCPQFAYYKRSEGEPYLKRTLFTSSTSSSLSGSLLLSQEIAYIYIFWSLAYIISFRFLYAKFADKLVVISSILFLPPIDFDCISPT